jgi:hypothetical protein
MADFVIKMEKVSGRGELSMTSQNSTTGASAKTGL